MATKVKGLSDEELLRFARMYVVNTASAFGEQQIATNLSIERAYIWLIHFIEFDFDIKNVDDVGVGSNESYGLQITREHKTEILEPNDPDLIAYHSWNINRSSAIGSETGPLWFVENLPKRFVLPYPLPFAGNYIYFGAQNNNASGDFSHYARIGYTLKKVSDAFFFRVAQALVSA